MKMKGCHVNDGVNHIQKQVLRPRNRNFEAGILTDDPALVEAAMNQFDTIWAGFKCKDCGRKQYCSDPIDCQKGLPGNHRSLG